MTQNHYTLTRFARKHEGTGLKKPANMPFFTVSAVGNASRYKAFTYNLLRFILLPGLLFSTACNKPHKVNENLMNHSPAADNHSYARPTEAVVQHIGLDLAVNFETKTLSGKATLIIRNISGGEHLWLDSRGLRIDRITIGTDEKPTTFEKGKLDSVMGESINVKITQNTGQVNVYYSTGPDAEALQWLQPSQTAGKVHPFLFTQGEAILTRSWIPCQDSPGIRCTYSATLTVPKGLMAVMSAENPTEPSADGKYRFEMKQPVPPYLIALSVGDLAFRSLGPKTGVYAEPSQIDKAAYEFAETEKMLDAAEKLYGKYRWGRYDLLVLPPSFPFGGMENPRLTFATPTILAGDRSLTSLVAHEMAHSWSGNLVTNETWNDFWLNEGFTVYFERRIMEALYGPSYSEMLAQLGYEDLQETLKKLGEGSNATCLKLNLRGQNPDDGMNDIAYEKGAFFLTTVEQTVGREKFDAFLKSYFDSNAFSTMNTERFLKTMNHDLLGNDPLLINRIQADKWVYSPGLPANCPKVHSSRFAKTDEAIAAWKAKGSVDSAVSNRWSSHEWLYFLRNLPKPLQATQMEKLDKSYRFTESGNSEIAFEWFKMSIDNNYKPAFANMEAFLERTGRRKFILPLYQSLCATDKGKHLARMIYKKARPNYHFVATHSLDPLIGPLDEAPAPANTRAEAGK